MLTVAEAASKTDTGRQRNANEDSYFASEPVFAVADGMGGAQAGEVASRIAASAFETDVDPEQAGEGQLAEIVHDANREIHDLAQRDSSRAGMGTTLTAALVQGNEVSFAHVGDSRAYVLRDGGLKRLTKDHSLVEELRSQGRLTDAEAEEHPQRSIITRALGPEPEVNVDTMTFTGKPGDVFLLCSDGLTTMVSDEEIARVLGEAKSLRASVNRLVDAANRSGGRDNITAVAFRLEEEGEAAPEEGATLISRTAEQAGLTGDRMRAASDRLRGRGPMPPPPRRRRALRIAIALAVAALVIGGAVFLARQVYFIGTDDSGRVALFRGLPYELPLGVNLYSEQSSIGVEASSLSPDRQDTVTEHQLRDRDDAVDLIDDIEQNEGSRPAPAPQEPTRPKGAQPQAQQQGSGQAQQGASGAP